MFLRCSACSVGTISFGCGQRPLRELCGETIQAVSFSTDWEKNHFFFYVPATSEVWSFAHDHASGNFRWFAFLKTGCKRVSVNSISWYYQCDISDLTRDEIENEKEYRLQQGLQPLK